MEINGDNTMDHKIEWDKLAEGSAHYQKNIKRWTTADDCVQGSEAVKAKGKMYLPSLGTKMQESVVSSNLWYGENAYEQYKQRAVYSNMTARTVDTYVGSLFMKQPRMQHHEDTAFSDLLR